MLTMEQKLAILDTFTELTRRNVSLGRINYHYEDSASDKKTVVYHLHPNGNGFVYAVHTATWGKLADDRGMVNIREFSEEELRAIVAASITSLSPKAPAAHTSQSQINDDAVSEQSTDDSEAEHWFNADEHRVTLRYDNEMWMIFAGPHLEDAFESYEEAVEYLQDEGFARV